MAYTSSSLAIWEYLLCSADRQCTYLVFHSRFPVRSHISGLCSFLDTQARVPGWVRLESTYSVMYRAMAQLNCMNGGTGGWRPGSRARMALHLSPWIRHTCAPWNFQIRLYHHLQKNRHAGWDYYLSIIDWNALCQDLKAGCFNSLAPSPLQSDSQWSRHQRVLPPLQLVLPPHSSKGNNSLLAQCCRWFQALPDQKTYSFGQCQCIVNIDQRFFYVEVFSPSFPLSNL